jgi:dTDP-4-dehydrorhamnose reductase
MKLLVTGSSGLLGLNLALDSMAGHQVTGVDRGRLAAPPFGLIRADLLADGAVERVLEEARPDWLINCAALADLDACEGNPELARRLNVDLPGQLAEACVRYGIRLVHISTDAVFDGEKDGSYSEQDAPNPLSVYARTKLDGERAVLSVNPQALVARANFYGWSMNGRRSLAEFFVNNLTHDKSMSGFTDIIFCPMFVRHTTQLLVAMLDKRLTGLYHVVGSQAMSKYHFGVDIARRFQMQEGKISPKSILSSSLTARRSNNLSLSIHKLSANLGLPIPEFSTGLEEFYEQYQQGFPQKIRSYQQARREV